MKAALVRTLNQIQFRRIVIQLCHTNGSPVCRLWLVRLTPAAAFVGVLVFSDCDAPFDVLLDRGVMCRQAFHIFLLEL